MAARTLGNLALRAFWGLGYDGWDGENDLNLLKLSVLVQGYVDSKETAEPGSPTDGDIVILDENHGTHPNEVAVRDDGAWVYIVPSEGWKLYNVGQSYYEFFNGAVWAQETVGLDYRFGGFAEADILDSEVLMRHIAAADFTIPADLLGSQVDVKTNPADGSWVGDLQLDGVSIGTITISTGGIVTLVTESNEEKAVISGGVLTLVGPGTADSAIAGLSYTFVAAIT